jgi:hypothetical protein
MPLPLPLCTSRYLNLLGVRNWRSVRKCSVLNMLFRCCLVPVVVNWRAGERWGVRPEVALVAAPPLRLRQTPSEAEDGISRAEDPIEIQIEANTDVVRGTTWQR